MNKQKTIQELIKDFEIEHKSTIDVYKKYSKLGYNCLAHIDSYKMIEFAEFYHKHQLKELKIKNS